MKIVSISDTHGSLPDNLPEGNVLTMSGDICPDFLEFNGKNNGEYRQRNWIKTDFIPWCEELIQSGKFQDIVFIAGNHDFIFTKPVLERSRFSIQFPDHVHFLQDSGVMIGGIKFYGTPWCTKFGSWAFMVDDDVLKQKFDLIPNNVDVLLSHCPLKGYGDDVQRFNLLTRMKTIEEAGSEELLKAVLRANPKFVLTGHIHCGSHRDKILSGTQDTTIVNVSVLDDTFDNIYAPFEFEINSAIKAYKLLHLREDGTLGPLFVGRKQIIPVGEYVTALNNLPHPGLAHRPGFHCCSTMSAPHIKMKLKNGERRVWCLVSIEEYEKYVRPDCQGGLWYVAKKMKIEKVIQ